MANTNTYINKIVVPNGTGNTITANLVDTVSGYSKTGVYIQDLFSTVNETALGTAYENGDVILGHYAGPQGENWFYNLVYYHGPGLLAFSRIQDSTGPNPHETWSSDTLVDVVEYSTNANPQWTQRSLPLITDIKVDNTSVVSTDNNTGITSANIVTSSTHPYNATTNPMATVGDIAAAGGGTVTGVTAGAGLTTGNAGTSGGTIDASGTISHSNQITAQTTQAVYPIKIDSTGHISAYGSAVTIPSDTKVTQRQTTNDDEYEILLAYGTGSSDITDIAYRASGVTVNPDDNSLSASTLYGDLKVQGEAVTPALSDYILISDATSTGTVKKGIAIGSSTTTYLRNDGTWQTPPNTITGWYGTCSTTASTSEKAVTCSGYTLNTGNIIGVYFSTANTAATPTLNVNSTGAKSIYVGNMPPTSTTNVLKWSAYTMIYFMYDGTGYRYLYASAEASVKPSRGAGTWYGTSDTAASTQAKTSTIDNYVLTLGSLAVIKFTNANTYTSAKITLNINSTGAKDVYYNGSVTSSTNTLKWDAGETVTFMYDGSYYHYITKTKGYAATSTYSSTGTDAVNGTAVNAALQTLDSSISATTGQAISAITITDGKIASSSKISVGEANLVTDVQVNGNSILSSKVANLITNTAYNSSTNKIATMSDITDSDKVFVVNVTLTSLTGGTSDKSSTDIYNAARAGKMVIAKVPYNGVQMMAVLVAAARDTSDDIAVFQYQNQKPSGLLSSFGFAKLTIVMNTVVVELAAADAATLGGTYLYSGGSANDGITLAAENGIDIDYLSQAPLSNGNVYTLRHTNAVNATTGSAAVYPITIDAQGHISSYGSAVTIPAAVAVKGNAESSYRTGNVNLTPANLGISATTSSVTVGSTTFTNTDTKVTNTLANTTKYYVTGTTSSSTNTGTQSFDSGIYATTTAGQLNATTYKVNENVTLQWNATDSSLDFVF